MACIPCVLIPLFLYIWHKWLAPIFVPILSKVPLVKNLFQDSNKNEKSKAKSSEKAKCPLTGKSGNEKEGKEESCPAGKKEEKEPAKIVDSDLEEKDDKAPPGWECVDGVCRKIPAGGATTRRRARKAD